MEGKLEGSKVVFFGGSSPMERKEGWYINIIP